MLVCCKHVSVQDVACVLSVLPTACLWPACECTFYVNVKWWFAGKQTLVRPDSFHEAVRHGHRGIRPGK